MRYRLVDKNYEIIEEGSGLFETHNCPDVIFRGTDTFCRIGVSDGVAIYRPAVVFKMP